MKASKVIGLDTYSANLKKYLTYYWFNEQTNRLISYANKEVLKIGTTINSYNSRHHMDDTGNLLDSLCWGVCYDGQLLQGGYFREQKAKRPSVLHGWTQVELYEGGGRSKWKQIESARKVGVDPFSESDAGEPVNGHALAEEFIRSYSRKCRSKHWMVFFAILAPYWGYWENGFNMVHSVHGNRTYSFQKFAVMTQYYDEIGQDLKPAKMSFRSKVDTYASKSLYSSAKKNLKNPQRFDRW